MKGIREFAVALAAVSCLLQAAAQGEWAIIGTATYKRYSGGEFTW